MPPFPTRLLRSILHDLFGVKLPSDVKMVFHPNICSALSADVAVFAFAYISHLGVGSSNSLIAMKMRSFSDENMMPETEIGSTGNKSDWETKTTQVGKQKSAVKGSNQIASKVLGPKQLLKKPSVPKKAKGPNIPEAKREKKNLDFDLDGTKFDFSGVPSPICFCTDVARVCYKWGASGWQSSCCTINISECPVPMSPTRPGARVAGRKMTKGAYFKLLLRLAAEGYDLSHPVDLKDHWGRHGANKLVTIK
ncbi:Protein BASIC PENTACYSTEINE7 [Hibiscus syriacus]|uniref:GAGA-binding transcriptional activator n=1 Tax=Hibiscus syriacus TaxID=106335 RepID=A0A6A2ZN91_HIBSY|nr:Protein BASIC PENTACYSTEINE7 [Hibiscus syriacus]